MRRSDRWCLGEGDDGQSKDRTPNARSRGAVSRRPLFSTRLSRSRSSSGVISAIGRFASGLAKSCKSQRFFSTVISAIPLAFRFSMYSAATRPKVLRAAEWRASRSIRFS